MDPLQATLDYHERTKHHLDRYARSLGYLDWATQPDPFRRFHGARLIALDELAASATPTFDAACAGLVAPVPVDRRWVSQLFYDSLALSAWKEHQGSRWALRVNPSSGNLHPTEAYLVAGPIPGLLDLAAVCHYAPLPHALEVRRSLEPAQARVLLDQLPPGGVLLGLTSIPWRESWKYGERALRYCQHDVGHAIGAVAVAAAGLGYLTRVLTTVDDEALAALLGLDGAGVEAEHPDCLLALWPQGAAFEGEFEVPASLVAALRRVPAAGVPNQLSTDHHAWEVIDATLVSTRRQGPAPATRVQSEPASDLQLAQRSTPMRQIVRQRRSAVAMDGSTELAPDAFERLLASVLPSQARLTALPWSPRIHLVLFVHRVPGLRPGIYALVRAAAAAAELRRCMRADFLWEQQGATGLPLFLLAPLDVRHVAKSVCCHQDIAADGAFAVAMLAEYEPSLRSLGPWFYRALHWEAGLIGQVLYLEAEAAGVQATGIGCFFDDALHALLGLRDRTFQTLYHFTVGGAVEDPRLRTLPAYGHRSPTP